MWFWSPVKRFEHRLRRRERVAYVIHEDLSLQRCRDQNLQLAKQAVHDAKDDEAIYERLMRTTAPKRLTDLLNPSLLLWMRARDVLGDLTRRDMLPERYRKDIALLRGELEDLGALTRLARIALHRPLTVGEQAHLQEIQRRQT